MDPHLPRPDLILALKAAEAVGVEAIRTKAAGPWRPGLGRAMGECLSGSRERIVKLAAEASRSGSVQPAVIALGGLARRELAPGSDLDILVLHEPGAPVGDFVASFFQILWDAGLKAAASTRTVKDSLAQARVDDDFFTSLLEARLLLGAPGLFEELKRAFVRVVRARGRGLVRQWHGESLARMNGVAGAPLLFAKDPDLKKGPGGVRSLHAIDWTYAIDSLLSGRGGARPRSGRDPAERVRLSYARDFILGLRIMLHCSLEGVEDRLAPDHQMLLAGRFGGTGSEADRTRSFMRHYFRQVLFVNRILFRETERVAGRVTVRGVVSVQPGRPAGPAAVFRLLDRLGSRTSLFAASVIGYLRTGADGFQAEAWLPVAAVRLPALLSRPRASQALRALHLSGLLHRLVPALAPVRLAHSFHPAHLHPVDVHSIEAVAVLENLLARRAGTGLEDIVRETAADERGRLWIVKLALLLHDAGKGFPGDHVQNGVEIAGETLAGLGIAPAHRAAILFLISRHLLLSGAARRRDTTDPAVLAGLADEFIRSPFPEEYLDLVLILTWADTRAADPRNLTAYFMLTLMRTWERVRELVLEGERSREPGRNAPPAADKNDREYESFRAEMGGHYLARNDESAVRRDWERLRAPDMAGPAFEVRSSNEFVKVKCYALDRPGLFALFAGILSLNRATIVRADIHTWRGRALDEFYVTHIFESESAFLDPEYDLARWASSLNRDGGRFWDDLDGLSVALGALKRDTRGLGARFIHPARASVTPLSGRRALVEVSGRDRPALLFDLATAMAREGVEVYSAFIDTTGWLIEDRFAVILRDETRAVRDRVRAALEQVLRAGEG